MKRLYLIRHAQSEYNEKGIFQGRLDSDLTPLGFVQARLCALALKDKGISVIYTSPQRRAYKTALTISDILQVPLKVDERLVEMSFGVYEGTPFWKLVEENREMLLNWLKNPVENPLPTQESMEAFERRVRSFLEDLKKDPHNSVAVVAHGGVLHAMICMAIGLGLGNLWNIHKDNTSISLLEMDEKGFRLLFLNDTCHLSSL
ncbi:Phosphoglycerate mutase [Thermocrinis albus DSM 14484]|uniref:Phosphoglycerate mutase n=1 Tax=Thermocrinis albus (strain DSM 14484 / JCM 11386 / HI 11/12) TaxID=638303 RepID=D3SNK7_THEAH|nr:histidine phosphatase family protein [Thermocrinis albus]ADC88744.1 Phosphoglycerate mutase [Thermocrinis albus DSM 14484]